MRLELDGSSSKLLRLDISFGASSSSGRLMDVIAAFDLNQLPVAYVHPK